MINNIRDIRKNISIHPIYIAHQFLVKKALHLLLRWRFFLPRYDSFVFLLSMSQIFFCEQKFFSVKSFTTCIIRSSGFSFSNWSRFCKIALLLTLRKFSMVTLLNVLSPFFLIFHSAWNSQWLQLCFCFFVLMVCLYLLFQYLCCLLFVFQFKLFHDGGRYHKETSP